MSSTTLAVHSGATGSTTGQQQQQSPQPRSPLNSNSSSKHQAGEQHARNSTPSQYGAHQLVKARLPNQQRTTVSFSAGMTVREALEKALKMRKLEPDMCMVFRLSPQSETKQRIDWDVDVAMLKGDEIVVESRDRVPMHTQLSHNFAKFYFNVSRCHFCQELLVSGIRCMVCGIEFHKNCSKSVPKLCEPAIEHSNYYRHLLARSSGFSPSAGPGPLTSVADSPTNTTRPIRPRARSADENSKHKSKSNSSSNNPAATPAGNQQPHSAVDHSLNDSNNNNTSSSSNNNHNTSTHPEHLPHSAGHHKLPSEAAAGIGHSALLLGNHLVPHYNSGAGFLPPNSNHHHHHHHHHGQHSPSARELAASPLSANNHHNHQQQHHHHHHHHQTHSRDLLLEERWEIDGDEIIRGPKIGQGSFATVYKGNWHGPVALKELNVKDPTPAQLQDFKNEVVVLKKTRHPNVLLFIGYVLKPELVIVTQWCKGRSLYKHLHVEERREFTNCEIKNIAIGVAQGMDYLHARNIIHRDLKSNNIFIHDEDHLTVKIGDFGLACFKTRKEGNQHIYHPTGSILWMAPEVIRTRPGVNPFTFQSDVYSYGIVLYELLSRKLPYFDFKHKDALLFLIGLGDPVRSPKLNLNVISLDKPEGLKTLMLSCTERDAENRPLFSSIIRDLKKIKLSRIPRSTSEPLRLNGSLPLDTSTYFY